MTNRIKSFLPPRSVARRLGARAIAVVLRTLLGLSGVAFAAGCESPSRYATIDPLVSPYDSPADALWAVVPPRNESGLSVVDTAAVGDRIVDQVQQIRGIRCLPVNRTLNGMRELGLDSVDTPGQARALAKHLGADAMVIGSVTAYDPYDPPSMGLTLALFQRDAEGGSGDSKLFDPRIFQMQATDLSLDLANDPSRPSSVGGGLYDARAHDTIALIQRYAVGRIDPDSPYGWRIYLASMPLYSEFVAHESVKDLIASEWLRLASSAGR